jgi:hypothetical protein
VKRPAPLFPGRFVAAGTDSGLHPSAYQDAKSQPRPIFSHGQEMSNDRTRAPPAAKSSDIPLIADFTCHVATSTPRHVLNIRIRLFVLRCWPVEGPAPEVFTMCSAVATSLGPSARHSGCNHSGRRHTGATESDTMVTPAVRRCVAGTIVLHGGTDAPSNVLFLKAYA